MVLIVVVLGVIAYLYFQLVCAFDEMKRARGRRRRNDILTEYGYGSTEEKIASWATEKAYGCLVQILFVGGILAVLLLLGLVLP